MHSSDAYFEGRFFRVQLKAFLIQLDGSQRLILSHGHLDEFQVETDHVLLLHGRAELSLRLLYHAHLELALGYSGFPPPVVEVCRLGCFICNLQGSQEVGFDVYQVVYDCLSNVSLLDNLNWIKLVWVDELASLLSQKTRSSKSKEPPARSDWPVCSRSLACQGSGQVASAGSSDWSTGTWSQEATHWPARGRHGFDSLRDAARLPVRSVRPGEASSRARSIVDSVIVHQDVRDPFLIYLQVVDVALLSQGSALEKPSRLVPRVPVEHLSADFDALVPLLPIEFGVRKKERVHIG